MGVGSLFDTVLVVGVNTRPVVESAKKLDLKVISVDHFGDFDLSKSADVLYSPKTSGGGSLFDLAFQSLDVHDPDIVLLCSGIEHHPQKLKKLEMKSEIAGNTPEKIEFCEDKERLYQLADRLNIPHPTTQRVSSLGKALKEAEEIGYPVVLRPSSGGGGIGIELTQTPRELKLSFNRVLHSGNGKFLYVQEYIKGKDLSASIISDRSKAECIIINEQIVGDKNLNVPRRFGYCGNITPFDKNPSLKKQVAEYSQTICDEIGLLGSNGVDFVVSDGPYLMEVNPRFQNTIDSIEAVLDINLVQKHLQACRENVKEYREPNGYSAKLILYADEDTVAPDLSRFKEIADIPQEDSMIKKGEPICSIKNFGTKRKKTISGAYKKAAKILDICRENSFRSNSPA